jgi:hypothetical protein
LVLQPVISSDARAADALKLSPMLPEGARAEAVLDTLPGKKALIKLSYRPPNYETPIDAFGTAITPNDVFFVRYHLSDIPKVDANTWKVAVGGDGPRCLTGTGSLRALSFRVGPGPTGSST